MTPLHVDNKISLLLMFHLNVCKVLVMQWKWEIATWLPFLQMYTRIHEMWFLHEFHKSQTCVELYMFYIKLTVCLEWIEFMHKIAIKWNWRVRSQHIMHAFIILSISSLNYIYCSRCAMCISALVLSTLSTIEEFQGDMTRVIIFLVSVTDERLIC